MCVCILISRKPIKVDILKEALYCKAQANKTGFNLIIFHLKSAESCLYTMRLITLQIDYNFVTPNSNLSFNINFV